MTSFLGYLYLQRDTMTTTTFIKESTSLGLAFRFQYLFHYHHDKKHCVQVHMVMKKDLRVPDLHRQVTARNNDNRPDLNI